MSKIKQKKIDKLIPQFLCFLLFFFIQHKFLDLHIVRFSCFYIRLVRIHRSGLACRLESFHMNKCNKTIFKLIRFNEIIFCLSPILPFSLSLFPVLLYSTDFPKLRYIQGMINIRLWWYANLDEKNKLC